MLFFKKKKKDDAIEIKAYFEGTVLPLEKVNDPMSVSYTHLVLTSNHRLHIIKPIEIVGNTKIPAEAQHNKNRNAKHPLFYSK